MFNHANSSELTNTDFIAALGDAYAKIDSQMRNAPSKSDMTAIGCSFESFGTSFSKAEAISGIQASLSTLMANAQAILAPSSDKSRPNLVAEQYGSMDSVRKKQILKEVACYNGISFKEAMENRIARTNKEMMDEASKLGLSFVNESLGSAFKTPHFITMASEAYADPRNENYASVTLMYNLLGIDQCEFTNKLFNTLVLPIEQAGIITNINIPSLRYRQRNWRPGDSFTQFVRKPFQDMFYTPETVLDFSDTRLYPVYRNEADSSLNNVRWFVPNGPERSVNQEGAPVPTAWLSFDTSADPNIPFLKICQTDANLAQGSFNDTDTIRRSIKLRTVLLKLVGKNASGTTVTEWIPIDVTNFQTSLFTNLPYSDNTQNQALNFHTQEIVLTKNTVTSTGATSAILGTILSAGHVVVLGMRANMTMKLDEGRLFDVSHDPRSLRVISVKDASGTLLASGDTTYQNIAGATGVLATTSANPSAPALTAVGFDLEAYRANDNNRTIGMVLDNQTWRGLLTSKVRESVGAIMPPDNATSGINSSATVPQALQELLVCTKVMTEKASVDKLFEARTAIANLQAAKLDNYYQNAGFTMGATMVRPWMEERNAVDIRTLVRTLDSSSALDDVGAAVCNYLRSMLTTLTYNSHFVTANKFFNGNSKIKVTIATHWSIAQWLQRIGDIRTLGMAESDFEVEIAHTTFEKMIDHVYVVISGGNSNGSFNPTAFGHMVWSPEIVAQYQKSDQSAVSNEMRVQPSFDHYLNLPILGHVMFPGFSSYFNQAQLYQVGTAALNMDTSTNGVANYVNPAVPATPAVTVS